MTMLMKQLMLTSLIGADRTATVSEELGANSFVTHEVTALP
jgi:hypothetical protein